MSESWGGVLVVGGGVHRSVGGFEESSEMSLDGTVSLSSRSLAVRAGLCLGAAVDQAGLGRLGLGHVYLSSPGNKGFNEISESIGKQSSSCLHCCENSCLDSLSGCQVCVITRMFLEITYTYFCIVLYHIWTFLLYSC